MVCVSYEYPSDPAGIEENGHKGAITGTHRTIDTRRTKVGVRGDKRNKEDKQSGHHQYDNDSKAIHLASRAVWLDLRLVSRTTMA